MPLAAFDFQQPLPMPAGAARLVAAVQQAAPRTGMLLGAAAGRLVDVRCTAVRRAAVVELVTGQDVWAPLRCALPGTCLLLVPSADAVALADLLMGGAGQPEARATTPLERQLVLRHLMAALTPVDQALAEWGAGDLVAGPASEDPLPAGSGEVVAVVLLAALPSGATSTVTLCLPARSLLPAEAEPSALPVPSATEQALAEVPVTLALRLPTTVVAAADVADLAEGDVLRLDADAPRRVQGSLAAPDGELQVLTAALGARGPRRAVVVHELLGGLHP